MLAVGLARPQRLLAQNSTGFDITRNLDVLADIYRQLDKIGRAHV